jgi:NMD protein affecting ribosome stability and mRNA decay
MFKKTCYECGIKIDKLYEGKCKDCFKKEFPPITNIKPINLKFCNGCLKLNYNNQFLDKKEIERRLPEIVKKNLIINKHYKLNKLNIKNFEINGEKVSFNIEVDCELKN